MTEPTQLYPIKILCFEGGRFNTQLYFHTPEDDVLYKIKNKNLHHHLRLKGTFCEIHLDETEIVNIGTLQQFKQQEKFQIYYL